jgi:hypothetical protein
MQADALTAEAEAVHAVSTKLKALESQLSFKVPRCTHTPTRDGCDHMDT